ncbi:hypothetical protein SADUNF_Sadunf03G0061700 [Salix dunnii]|uniref:Pentatricopeptide repeat-containing protein n=1 Tax=Salix dunnii TaxID=1413687 RepID=A0A835N3B1_9ROSI|nr:hypothetical protein SADUNF_Sadunf03G0061700 [Salix dunnii]
MSQLKQIQAQIFRGGFHQSTDTLKKLVVFCVDPSNGNLVHAERVFNYIQNPGLFVYNVMIKAFAKKGIFRKCLMLFNKLREDGLWPDNFTYPFVLKAIGCLGEALEAEKIHGFVRKTGLEFDSYVCNSLMDIEESYLNPNEPTVVSTLSACAALKCLELGKEIHFYVRERLELTSIIGSALLDMYCKCGCLSVAREIFDGMPHKNVICWTSMVSGYVNYGELDKARELFDRSPVRDVVLWTAMINGYVQFNHFDKAVALFQEMQIQRVKPDKFVLVALLTGCAQMGALEQGTWIHGYIDEKGIPVDAVVGTSLIEMYSKCGCIEKALRVFCGLREKDTATWTSIICGLAMNGKTSKALELFSKMKQVEAIPDEVTFIGVLSACSHGGLVKEGREFFNSMTSIYNIEPKLEHYGCLIDLLGRAGQLDQAEELIKKITNANNEIIVPLYGSLLSACRIYKNVQMGERVAEQLLKIESRDSRIRDMYNALMKIFGMHNTLPEIMLDSKGWAELPFSLLKEF